MNWRSFLIGVAATAALGVVAGIAVVALRPDSAVSGTCYGATARSTFSRATDNGEIIATVTVIERLDRDWEIQETFYGPDERPIPLAQPDFARYAHIIALPVGADPYPFGNALTISIRPVGEREWCDLKSSL